MLGSTRSQTAEAAFAAPAQSAFKSFLPAGLSFVADPLLGNMRTHAPRESSAMLLRILLQVVSRITPLISSLPAGSTNVSVEYFVAASRADDAHDSDDAIASSDACTRSRLDRISPNRPECHSNCSSAVSESNFAWEGGTTTDACSMLAVSTKPRLCSASATFRVTFIGSSRVAAAKYARRRARRSSNFRLLNQRSQTASGSPSEASPASAASRSNGS
mmetsp:Transcript_11379/g.30117  ORF Transcript_11379/g.30117 Transcript_11379/m.30117 type:complete len:218 (+) Transcript_11379:872-1525(+)